MSFGTILGDGVAVYDSANINVRTLTAPLFAPAPAPLDELVAALIGQVDSVTDQVDVGEALGQVNDLLTQLGVPPISLTG